jgi:putative salt-induced outer membrane protein
MKSTGKASVAILLFCSGVAIADEPAPPGPPPVWSGKAEASYVGTTGNTNVQTVGAGLEVDYKKDVWDGLAKGAYVQGKTDDVTTAKTIAAELRGGRHLSPRFELFAQADYFKNEFAGIDNRLSGIGGGAYSVVKTDAQELKFQLGAGYTKENRSVGEDKSFASGQAGLLYKWKISSTTDLSEEFSYVDSFKDSSDWRVANTFSLTVAINKLLSLKASHNLTYLNEPVPGFGKTDTITSIALVAKF